MNPTTPKSFRKSIQVLVFQDGLASRSFEIPLSWISRLGWYLGGCALVTILAITGTIQLWKSSHRSQPERLRELEQQIQTLGDANKALEAKAVAAASSAASPTPTLTAATAAVEAPAATNPVQCVVPTLAPAVALPNPAPQPHGAIVPASVNLIFQAFPPSIEGEVPMIARPSIPIEVTSPEIRWRGRKLGLQFDIRYTGEEGKNQQGRIIVIARGPETLLSYPTGVIQGADHRFLLDPEKGEFFSVSRFRQTKVEFPAIDSSLSSIEILLIGSDPLEKKQKILIREILKVPAASGAIRATENDDT